MKQSMLILYYHYYHKQALRLKSIREKDGLEIILHKVDNKKNYSNLKSIVDNYYSKEKFKYLCLIGNEDEIPGFSTNYENNAMSDIYYGLNGNKIDILVGRITSGDSSYLKKNITKDERLEYVTIQLNKIEEYQRDQKIIKKWKSNIIGIGSSEGAGYGYNKMDDLSFVKEELNEYSKNNNTICISSNDSLKKSLINNGASCIMLDMDLNQELIHPVFILGMLNLLKTAICILFLFLLLA